MQCTILRLEDHIFVDKFTCWIKHNYMMLSTITLWFQNCMQFSIIVCHRAQTFNSTIDRTQDHIVRKTMTVYIF